jgi:predicted O-methyltransferase YrrM
MIRQMRSGDNIKGLEDLIEKLPNDLKMIEVGTYAGESAEIFLKSGKVKEIYCIDLWHIKDWAEAEKPVDELMKKYPQLSKLKMSSESACVWFDDGMADFVYIDANHYYEPCKKDIINYLPKIKKGGWIGGHDYKMESVKRAVKETLGEPDFLFKDSSWLKQL